MPTRIILMYSIVLVAFAVCTTGLQAHTRERLRIDAVEAAMRKNNALFSEQMASQTEKLRQLDSALEERRAHGTRFEQRMRSLEDGVQEGLRAIRDTIAKQIDRKIAVLDERASAAERERKAMAKTLEAYEATMAAFRKSLADYARGVNDKVAALRTTVTKLEGREAKHHSEAMARLKGLVTVMDEENKKMRKAITDLARPRAATVSAATVAPPHTADGRRQVHQVQRGESLWSIARKYSLSTQALLKANHDLEAAQGVIHPGDALVIPRR